MAGSRIPDVRGVAAVHASLSPTPTRQAACLDRGEPSRCQLVDTVGAAATQRRHGTPTSTGIGLGTGINGRISLPTPSGQRTYRIAATLTNMGWGPGAVILNANDYRRAWLTNDPSAIEINLKPGVVPATARRAVQTALGADAALRVQTSAERDRQFQALARQGLVRLSQISALLLIAAGLAMAAAMGAAIWQRRIPLARLRIDGFEPARLWTTLMLEAAVVLGVGCAIGATFGTYGHLLGGRWLTATTGYPVPLTLGWVVAATTSLLVAAGALVVTAVPGAFAANASPRVGLQEQ